MNDFRCVHCGERHPYGNLVIAAVGEQVDAKPPDDPDVIKQVKRIAELSTRRHEFGPNGEFLGWINPKEQP